MNIRNIGPMGIFEKQYGLSSLCSSLWDSTVLVSSQEIEDLGLKKGITVSVSPAEQERVFSKLKQKSRTTYSSLGGSSCNLVRTLSALNVMASFSTIVGEDEAAEHIRQSLESPCLKAHISCGKGSSGSVLVLVSEDGERTMLASLGVSTELGKEHLKTHDILSSSIFHVCGYQWFHSPQVRAIKDGVSLIKSAGGKVSFDVADPFVTQTFKKEFLAFIHEDADIVFANEWEAKELFGKDLAGNDSLPLKDDLVFVHKLGKRGAKVYDGGKKVAEADALPVEVLDTTGAGDVFAAGFLAGYILKKDHERSAKIATILAADVITRFGVTCSGDALKAAQKLLHCPSISSTLNTNKA